MALTIGDRIVETTTTTGTGDITLSGAITGFARFDDYCTVGDRIWYMIEAIDGSGDATGDWEVGLGTYSATDTLARTEVRPTSAGYGSAVSLAAGTKRVSCAIASSQLAHRGCLAYKSADQTTANFTTATALTFDTDNYDTDAIHDIVTNTSRMTVPAGVSRVRLQGHVRVESHTASQYVNVAIFKNGGVDYVGQTASIQLNNLTVAQVAVTSPVLNVVAGDYFELFLEVGSDTSITVKGTRTWFSMEIVE
jgi:hypothetical protein